MCRAGIIPLDNTSDIAGPLARTVEDVARMLEVLVAVDPNDPLTNLSKFLGSKPANYTSALNRDALKVPVLPQVHNALTTFAESAFIPTQYMQDSKGCSLLSRLESRSCRCCVEA